VVFESGRIFHIDGVALIGFDAEIISAREDAVIEFDDAIVGFIDDGVDDVIAVASVQAMVAELSEVGIDICTRRRRDAGGPEFGSVMGHIRIGPAPHTKRLPQIG